MKYYFLNILKHVLFIKYLFNLFNIQLIILNLIVQHLNRLDILCVEYIHNKCIACRIFINKLEYIIELTSYVLVLINVNCAVCVYRYYIWTRYNDGPHNITQWNLSQSSLDILARPMFGFTVKVVLVNTIWINKYFNYIIFLWIQFQNIVIKNT